MGVLRKIDPPPIDALRPLAEQYTRRILIVMHDFSGGGTELVAVRLANQWAAAGRDVRIFCGSETGPVRSRVAANVSVECATPAIPRGPFSRWRLGRKLGEAAERYKPDIVFGPGNFHFLVLASFGMSGGQKAPIVCKISNPLVRSSRSWIGRLATRMTLRFLTARIDRLVAMSPALQEDAARHITAKAKIVSCWEPIACSRPSATFRNREPGLILAVGRLERQKDHALAIDAMALLSRDIDARLVILGEGSQRPLLESQIRDLGLEERVRLPGYVDDVGAWLDRASCFLMTSRFEGYPASLVEALAAGIPTLTTRCSPSVDDLIVERLPIELLTREASDIADAIAKTLAHRPHSFPEPGLFHRHEDAPCAARYIEVFDQIVRKAARRRRPDDVRQGYEGMKQVADDRPCFMPTRL